MSEPQNLPALRVIARGWDFEAWNEDFYPDDLPEDWRLGYYANEFRGVLVPDASWRDTDAEQMEAWFEDLAAPFDLYLELQGEMPARQVDAMEAALPAGLLKGILHGGGGEAPAFGVPVYRDADTGGEALCWRPGREHAGGIGVLELTLGEEPPARALRENLEAFLEDNRGRQQATLIVAGTPPSYAAMRDLEVMGQLLGA